MNDHEIEEILDGGAQYEEDVPLIQNKMVDESASKDKIESMKLENAEKEKERKEKRYFSAFRLIVGCLIFLGIVYAIDVTMSAVLSGEMSKITDSIIEIVKTLLFTLSGYLFARKENGD